MFTVKSSASRLPKERIPGTKKNKKSMGWQEQCLAIHGEAKGEDASLGSPIQRTDTVASSKVAVKHGFVVDASRSMSWASIYSHVCSALRGASDAKMIGPDSVITLFGEDAMEDSRNNPATGLVTFERLTSPRGFELVGYRSSPRYGHMFTSGTAAESVNLEAILRATGNTDQVCLVWIGDGAMRDASVLANKINNLMNGKQADRIAGLVLFLPFGVSETTVRSLKNAMSSVIQLLASTYRHVEFVQQKSANDRTALADALRLVPQSGHVLPAGYMECAGWCWSTNASSRDMMAALRANHEAVEDLVAAMLRTATMDEELLRQGVYARVHGLLRGIAKSVPAAQRYLDQMSALKSGSNSAAQQALVSQSWKMQLDDRDTLILAIISTRLRYRANGMEGITEGDVIRAIQDQSGALLRDCVRGVLRAGPVFCPTEEGKSMVHQGGFVPRRDRCKAGVSLSWTEACRAALERFFLVAAVPVRVCGNTLVRLAMQLVSDGTLEVPKVLLSMAKHVLIAHNAFLSVLGVSTKDNEVVVDDIWYDHDNAMMLHTFLELYKDDVLQSCPLDGQQELRGVIELFRRMYSLISQRAAFASAAQGVCIHRAVVPTVANGYEFKVGDLVLLRPWKGDALGWLPSVCVILSFVTRGGCAQAVVLYLDEAFSQELYDWASDEFANIADGVRPNLSLRPVTSPDTCHVKLTDLRLVATGPISVETRTRIFKTLFRWKLDAKEYHEDNERGDLDQKILDDYGAAPAEREIPVPLSVMVTVYEQMVPGLKVVDGCGRRHINEGLNSNVLDNAGVLAALATCKVNELSATFTIQGDTFELTPDELRRFARRGQEALRPEPCSKSQHSAKCAGCLEFKRPQNRVHVPGCQHAFCLECHGRMMQNFGEQLEPGRALTMRQAFCPQGCGALVIKEQFPAVSHFLRENPGICEARTITCLCADCNELFVAGDASCMDEAASLPRRCDSCRNPPPCFSCPECAMPCQLSSGCRMIRCCPRGYHGCMLAGCTHRVGGVQGCGAVYEISAEQAQLGQ
jgi:hypothetical protein